MTEKNTPATQNDTSNKNHGFLPILLDFGSLLVFFLVFKFSNSGEGAIAATKAVINGTLAFMFAIVIALGLSKWKLGRISPMLWLSAILIIGFGALTVYFYDEKFIQIKPTIIYSGFALLLLGGCMMGKAFLGTLMQAVYQGLDNEGWMKLSRNWGLYFLFLAILNEIIRYYFDFDTWLTIKVWGVTILSFIFALTQMPMMLRHGLDIGQNEEDEKAESETPAP